MVYVHIAQSDVIKGCTNMFVRGDETFQMEKTAVFIRVSIITIIVLCFAMPPARAPHVKPRLLFRQSACKAQNYYINEKMPINNSPVPHPYSLHKFN